MPRQPHESIDPLRQIEHGAGRTYDVGVGRLGLAGTLTIPAGARALVVFAHGSGSSRLSPRNRAVAQALDNRGFATLLFDLLTSAEEADRSNVFDIPLLGQRVVEVVEWASNEPLTRDLDLGLFGASTGAAAALVGAASRPDLVHAVVSRGGRPDLAETVLSRIHTPTLLIVGSYDGDVLELNRWALAQLQGPKSLEIIDGATHLFQEPGAMNQVIRLAAHWFRMHLTADAPSRPGSSVSEESSR
jgi:pimeloyl-ACP methyl ester carboxylesterase